MQMSCDAIALFTIVIAIVAFTKISFLSATKTLQRYDLWLHPILTIEKSSLVV